jgi:hypothetical protein
MKAAEVKTAGTMMIMAIMETVAEMVEIVAEENQEQAQQNKENIIIKNRPLERTWPNFIPKVSLYSL